jgi:uncharacterized protein YraI
MKKLLAASALFAALLVGSHSQAEEKGVITDNRVNVRGQAKLYSEVITQLKKGDAVTVLERIPAQNPKPGEPAEWAKIMIPTNTTVWVYAPMVKDGSVKASRLNLRAGPGENYSVVGRVEKGDALTEIRTVEDWMEIEPPATAYAFVDSSFVKAREGDTEAPAIAEKSEKTEEPAPAANARTPEPTEQAKAAPEPGTPAKQEETPAKETAAAPQPEPEHPKLEPAQVDAKNEEVAKTQETPAPTHAAAPGTAAVAAPALPLPRQAPPSTPPAAVPDLASHLPETAPEPPAREPEARRRIVRREGIVKGTFSIQAPTYFELESASTGKTINYLHAEKAGLKLKPYKKMRVVVTGEEFIDPRWPKTPVIEIDSLETVQ